ncbi:MAG: exodeoxyribonuclease VII small subunit [Paludibacteraceae bacterium]
MEKANKKQNASAQEEIAYTYDEAMARVETIVNQLEESDAMAMDEYKRLADEARKWLSYCRQQIEKMSDELKDE